MSQVLAHLRHVALQINRLQMQNVFQSIPSATLRQAMQDVMHLLYCMYTKTQTSTKSCSSRVHQLTAKVSELEESIREVYQHSKDNRKELGRLEGTSWLSYFKHFMTKHRMTH